MLNFTLVFWIWWFIYFSDL